MVTLLQWLAVLSHETAQGSTCSTSESETTVELLRCGGKNAGHVETVRYYRRRVKSTKEV